MPRHGERPGGYQLCVGTVAMWLQRGEHGLDPRPSWAGFLSLVVTAQCGLALKIKAPSPGSLPACLSGLFCSELIVQLELRLGVPLPSLPVSQAALPPTWSQASLPPPSPQLGWG